MNRLSDKVFQNILQEQTLWKVERAKKRETKVSVRPVSTFEKKKSIKTYQAKNVSMLESKIKHFQEPCYFGQ